MKLQVLAFVTALTANMLPVYPAVGSSDRDRSLASRSEIDLWVGSEQQQGLSHTTLLWVIADWLKSEFDLPEVSELPSIVFVSEREMLALQHPRPPTQEIVSLYYPSTRTIYLQSGWTDGSPMEVSILVHEMVHHLQELARTPYPCPAAREKLAFEAQDRWLERFDSDLSTQFNIDGLALLLRTNCLIE